MYYDFLHIGIKNFMQWKVINSGISPAKKNMELDEEIFASLEEPTLHFYEWESDSATFGYFVDPGKYLDLEKAQEKKLDLARRPTGGGVVFHIWDFAFSVLLPSSSEHFSRNTLENYHFVNKAVMESVKTFLGEEEFSLLKDDAESYDKSCERFCMARPTKYDVVLLGRKIAGAAQRRDKKGFLHQGSIAILPPDEDYLREVLLPNTKVVEAMQNFTYPLLPKNGSKNECTEVKRQLAYLLEKNLSELSL